MSGNGASGDEMTFGIRDDEQLGAFADALRATLIVAPDRARSAELVPRLAEAARASLVTGSPARGSRTGARRSSRLGLFARAAMAFALVPALFAGLAVAGVKLPDAAEAPFEAVGIDLPNQGSDAGESTGSGSGGDANGGGSGKDGSAADGKKGKPSEPGVQGRDNAAEKRGHGQNVENPAREQGRGNGAQGKGRALGKKGAAPGQSNPNRGGQGKARAVGQTDAPPPGQANKPVAPGKAGSGTDADTPGQRGRSTPAPGRSSQSSKSAYP
jgi:hypothetical protein